MPLSAKISSLQRQIQRLRIVLVLLLLLAATVTACYTSLFSFGDSLTDTGNLYFISPRQSPDCLLPPYGQTHFHRPNGRCSDGRLILDFLAESLGLPYVKPYLGFKNGAVKRGNIEQGVNFAVAGATALDRGFFEEKGFAVDVTANFSLGVQLDWFKELLPSLCNSSSSCKKVIGSSLFIVGEIGGNDYGYPLSETTAFGDLVTYIPQVISVITSAIRELIDLGAVTFMVPGSLPLGCNPAYLTIFATIDKEEYDQAGCLKWLNTFYEYHNELLQIEINRLRVLYPLTNIIYADYFNAALEFYNSPEQFGFGGNVLKVCCGGGGPYNYNETTKQTITYESREPDWTKENWTTEPTNWSSENWASTGKLESTEILDNPEKLDTTEKLENTDMLGTAGNIEAANNLDTSVMLDTSCKLDTAGMMDNHCDTAGMLNTNVDQAQEKVEFVTGEALPHPTSTSYQFGFHFSSAKDNESTWGQPIENSAGSMLNSMANIPTTSSSVSALTAIFEAHQQRLNNNGGPARPPTGNALSFSDTASVNFPPSSGQPGGGGPVVVHGGNAVNFAAAAAHQQQQQQAAGDPSQHVAAVHHHHQQQQQLPPQQNKTLFTPAANPAMVSATPAMQQHLQQQAQTIFHQTSATAVPQFPSYNMPYMYSPVATAQTLQGPNAEIDRFLIQQYGTPYSQLDLQMGAMSIGPPTTLAPNHHRATLESYMENKFGQQQQNVNQAANNGHYQQTQQSQQQQRGLAQSEQATLLGGPPSHVGPPPGFGMPTAPTQPSYVQPANIHSLFQMPTYPHPYQHPQYMMSNANRFQAAQRPAQTSPPEANVQNQRRGGGDAQGYAGGAVPDSTGEQHSAAVSQQYGNNFNHKYRSYM